MKLLKLIIINIIMWGIVHLIISGILFKSDIHRHRMWNWLYKTYGFEKSGETWDKIFKVKTYKSKLPESTIIAPTSFDSSKLKDMQPETLREHIDETNRSELTHWLSILPAPLFFLWNPKVYMPIHLGYALVSNVPFILSQRYNRPRLKKVYELKTERKKVAANE